MRHAVLGVGGVGGNVAVALAHEGEDVTLILRSESMASYPAELSLQTPAGSFSAPLPRKTVIDEPYDVVWLGLKATQLDAALAALAKPDGIGAIVPLLNGVDHVPVLRKRFGAERVVPATISVESERVTAGRILQTTSFVLLEMSATGESRLAPVAAKLTHFGYACKFRTDEITMLWNKLCFLAPFALATSASRLALGELLDSPRWNKMLYGAFNEACAVAAAFGAKVERERIAAVFPMLHANARSSMLKDLLAGNPPELDAIAGPVLRGGREHGVPVPCTTELAETVRRSIEQR